MALFYVHPASFAVIELADDGQGDLFHPHRNHLVTLWSGSLFYQLTADFYAYLREQREHLRERASKKLLAAEKFAALDSAFMQIRNAAILALGESALRVAVLGFGLSRYSLPTGIYRALPGEVSIPSWGIQLPAEAKPPKEAAPVSPETSSFNVTPAPPSAASPAEEPGGDWAAAKPGDFDFKGEAYEGVSVNPEKPNEGPTQTFHLNTQPTKGEIFQRCYEVISRCVDELSAIYFASEGFPTPFTWARALSATDKAMASKLSLLREKEEALDHAAASGDLASTEKTAILYLAAWRSVVYAYDDFVTEERAKLRASRLEGK